MVNSKTCNKNDDDDDYDDGGGGGDSDGKYTIVTDFFIMVFVKENCTVSASLMVISFYVIFIFCIRWWNWVFILGMWRHFPFSSAQTGSGTHQSK